MNGFLEWLHTQAAQLQATIGAVISNGSQPARSTIVYTLVTIGLIWALTKIIKLVRKK